jgi:hypothetical protein
MINTCTSCGNRCTFAAIQPSLEQPYTSEKEFSSIKPVLAGFNIEKRWFFNDKDQILVWKTDKRDLLNLVREERKTVLLIESITCSQCFGNKPETDLVQVLCPECKNPIDPERIITIDQDSQVEILPDDSLDTLEEAIHQLRDKEITKLENELEHATEELKRIKKEGPCKKPCSHRICNKKSRRFTPY